MDSITRMDQTLIGLNGPLEYENASIIKNFILRPIDKNNMQLIACDPDFNEAAAPSQNISSFQVLDPGSLTEAGNQHQLESFDSPNKSAEVPIIRSNKHQQEVDVTTYFCFKCHKPFTSLTLLRQHLKWHTLVKNFTCPKCPQGFNEENNLKIHMVIASHYSEESLDVCPICKIRFQRKASLKSHVMLHQVEELILCTECQEEFQNDDELVKHMESHAIIIEKMTNTQSASNTFTCKYCTMDDFETFAQYKQHVAKHVKIGRNVFKGKKTRKRNKNCKKESLFKCRFCRKTFPKNSRLSRHERIHTGERPYKCQYCQKGFAQNGTLMIHLYKHTGDKPFPCTLCPARFTQKGNLRVHVQKTHTVSKNHRVYRCVECTCIFRTLASLNGHITKAHLSKNEEEIEGEENIIDKVMNSLKQLNSELNKCATNQDLEQTVTRSSPPVPGTTVVKVAANHINGDLRRYAIRQKKIGDVRWYFCNYCTSRFKKPSDLIKHFSVHTLEKPFRCSKCNQTFALKTTLNKHQKVHEKIGCNCEYCDSSSGNNSPLSYRLALTTGYDVPNGSFNGQVFVKNILSRHSFFRTQSEPHYVCSLCKKVFSTLKGIQFHQLKHDNEIESKNIELALEPTLEQPLDHEMHGISLLKPALGEKKESETPSLERLHCCNKCDAKFTRRESLTRHMLGHTGQKFQCNLCPKWFLTKYRLKLHLNFHKSIKNFGCQTCGKKFINSSLLKRHIKIHERGKAFTCPYCDRQYKSEKLCRFHLRKAHQLEDIKLEKLKTSIINDNLNEKSDNKKTDEINSILNNTITTVNDTRESEKHAPQTLIDKKQDECIAESNNTLLLNVTTPQAQPPYEIFYLNIGDDGEILQENLMANRTFLFESLNSLQESTLSVNGIEQSRDLITNVESLVNEQQQISVEQFSAVDLGTLPINLIESSNSSLLPSNLVDGKLLPDDAHVICINCHKLFPGYDEFEKHVCGVEVTNQALVKDVQEENYEVEKKDHNTLQTILEELPNNCINNDTTVTANSDVYENKDLTVTPAKSKTKTLPLNKMKRCTYKKKLMTDIDSMESNKYSCPCCNFFTRFEDILRKHLTLHQDLTDRICKFCFKEFGKPSDLKRHLRTHTGERPFECEVCHKKFALKSTLEYHSRTHDLTEVKKIFCVVCNATFMSKSSLKVHMLLHTGVRPHVCKYCNQTFRTSAMRQTHERNVHIRKIESSSRNLKPKLSGVKHVKLLADEVADIVKNEAKSNQKQLLPEPTHPQTTFIINNPEQSDAVSLDPVFLMEQIQNSSIIIEGNGTVPLSLNDITLVDVGGLQLENKSSEQAAINSQPPVPSAQQANSTQKPPKVECDICHKLYASKDVLRKHKRKLHWQNKQFPCIKCDKGYHTLDELNRHIAKLHSGHRPYACQYCTNSFSEEGSLKTHVKRIHKKSSDGQTVTSTSNPILDMFSSANAFL